MEAYRPSRYLLTLAAMTVAGFVLVIGTVAIINPFGLVPLAPTIPGINTTKVARNANDRLIKRYDAINLKPRTVIVGTSRVKFAFDPDKVVGDFAPAYNAGIDALRITEARQLLEGYVRNGIPIKHVFFELFLFQFFHSWPGKPHEKSTGDSAIADILSTTISGGAVRAAIETIIASARSQAVATRQTDFCLLGGHTMALTSYRLNGWPAQGRSNLVQKTKCLHRNNHSLCWMTRPSLTWRKLSSCAARTTGLDTLNSSWDHYIRFSHIPKARRCCTNG